ncbi:hypothetical protein BC833DRAFT_276272 [Globomyces pollinis-pini]|nr:hypothetical protein BC833DRAFT_276272 [Globomyces pollinis-pini]
MLFIIVTASEIRKLRKRFELLDKQNLGFLTLKDLQTLPELAVNPLANRITTVFLNDRQYLTFRDFVIALSPFSKTAKRDIKLEFAFKVYDVDQDGKISYDDLFLMLKTMVGNSLNDSQIVNVVEQTLLDADSNQDGAISFDEFKRNLYDSELDILCIEI